MTDPHLPTVVEVIDKLAAVGSSVQIAMHLRQQQCVGAAGASLSCPVARYVRRETGESVQIGGVVYLRPGVVGAEVVGFLPDPIRDFIEDFDGGRYPDLIEGTDDV
jgi:hypothetical protein